MKVAELFPDKFDSLPDDVEKHSADWKSVSDQSEINQFWYFTQWFERLTLILFPLSGTT